MVAVHQVVLSDHLRLHDGVLTLRQAHEFGLTRQAVNRRVQDGRWRQLARGVYFVDDRPFTDSARIRAAVWGYGQRAVASGLAAAWWHGLARFAPDTVEVTVPRDSSGRRHPGSRPRRRDLAAADIVMRRGLQLTAVPLTALEAAARTSGGATILDAALQQNVQLRDMWRAQIRNKGRYGSPSARRLLRAASDGAHSQAERLLVALLRGANFTGWRTNHAVGRYQVDVAFPEVKVAIEVDGLAFHSSTEDFHKDRVRQNDITLLGWQVLRFTWLDLTEYPDRVVAVIRSAVSA